MKSCFRRAVLAAGLAVVLAGCGNRETNNALHAAKVLVDQKQYQDADDVLVAALRAREEKVRASLPAPTDDLGVDDLTKKVQADPEILKMEKAQIPIYLHLQRPDLASAVYTDILAGDPNTRVVFDALDDKDASMRMGAVRVLGLAAQPTAIGPLEKAIKDPDQDVRRAAVAALGAIRDPGGAAPPLIEALKDSYWFARSDAADALGQAQDPRAIEPLFQMISDPDKTAQNSAENALVDIANTKGVSGDSFAAHLKDANPKVVTVAAVCLAIKRDPRATPVLLQMTSSTDPDARLHAVKALGGMGDRSALPTLRQMLHDPEVNVRGWTIIALGKLNDLTSVPELRTIAADPNESENIRQAAGAAVDHITGNPSAASSPPPAPNP